MLGVRWALLISSSCIRRGVSSSCSNSSSTVGLMKKYTNNDNKPNAAPNSFSHGVDTACCSTPNQPNRPINHPTNRFPTYKVAQSQSQSLRQQASSATAMLSIDTYRPKKHANTDTNVLDDGGHHGIANGPTGTSQQPCSSVAHHANHQYRPSIKCARHHYQCWFA
jgi:hypothetical protein